MKLKTELSKGKRETRLGIAWLSSLEGAWLLRANIYG